MITSTVVGGSPDEGTGFLFYLAVLFRDRLLFPADDVPVIDKDGLDQTVARRGCLFKGDAAGGFEPLLRISFRQPEDSQGGIITLLSGKRMAFC